MAALRMTGRGRAFAVAITAALSWASSVQAQRVSEYQVKAAFLQNFSRFVEWPASSPAAAFTICILGDDPFGAWLDEATGGTRIKEKPLRLRRIRQVDEAAGCQTLFISASEAARMRALLDGLQDAPTLTVSDVPQFAQQGGMIGFTTAGGRVRFVANPAVARAAGLQLTAELLRVAAEVVGRPRPEE